MILEICCGDIDSVGAALTGGAGRIELCCGLEAGGSRWKNLHNARCRCDS